MTRVMFNMMLRNKARLNRLRVGDLSQQAKRIRKIRTRRHRKIIQRLLEL